MPRVSAGPATRRKRKRQLKQAKGYRGARGSLARMARESVLRGMAYATRDRRVKKRMFRRLWAVRINAGARAHGLTYGRLISGLKKSDVVIDRKILADLAVNDDIAFGQLVDVAKGTLEGIE